MQYDPNTLTAMAPPINARANLSESDTKVILSLLRQLLPTVILEVTSYGNNIIHQLRPYCPYISRGVVVDCTKNKNTRIPGTATTKGGLTTLTVNRVYDDYAVQLETVIERHTPIDCAVINSCTAWSVSLDTQLAASKLRNHGLLIWIGYERKEVQDELANRPNAMTPPPGHSVAWEVLRR